MLLLKLLNLKVWGAILVAVAFLVGSLLIYADGWSRAATRTVRQSQHEMKNLREWRLK